MSALDPANGKEIWRTGYPVAFTMHPAATKHGLGPKSTPVFADGKLFSIGMTGTSRRSTPRTGKQLWQKPGSMPLPMFTSHAFSPLVDRGLVIFHTGGHMQGALTAFDVNTGAEKWSWTGDGPGYGSPVIAEFGGTRQLVTITQGKLVSLDPATGTLLWERPYVSSNFTNAVTPVVYGQTLIVSGNGGPTVAFAVTKQNNQWVTADRLGERRHPVPPEQQRAGRRRALRPVEPQHADSTSASMPRPARRCGRRSRARPGNAAIVHAGDLVFSLEDDGRSDGVPQRRDGVRDGEEIHRRRFRDVDAADDFGQSDFREGRVEPGALDVELGARPEQHSEAGRAAYAAMILGGVALFLLVRHYGDRLTAPAPAAVRRRDARRRRRTGRRPSRPAGARGRRRHSAGCSGRASLGRQPPVIGEVVAGILLGPSLLGRIAPESSTFILPAIGRAVSERRRAARRDPVHVSRRPGAERRAAARSGPRHGRDVARQHRGAVRAGFGARAASCIPGLPRATCRSPASRCSWASRCRSPHFRCWRAS